MSFHTKCPGGKTQWEEKAPGMLRINADTTISLHCCGGSQVPIPKCHDQIGCPIKLVSDQGSHFLNKVVHELTTMYMIIHKKSSVYHPQSNGRA